MRVRVVAIVVWRGDEEPHARCEPFSINERREKLIACCVSLDGRGWDEAGRDREGLANILDHKDLG
jgi:hypothetical protein